MRSSIPANNSKPHRRRRKTSIAALLALCSLAAGVQALSPAPASAVISQPPLCSPNLPSGTLCHSGGGEVIVIRDPFPKPPPTPNPPACPTPGPCLPDQSQVGPDKPGGRPGTDEVSGPKAGGKPTFPGRTKKLTRKQCQELRDVGMIWSPRNIRDARIAVLKEELLNFRSAGLKARSRFDHETDPELKATLRKELARLDKEMADRQKEIAVIEGVEQAWKEGGCTKTLYGI